MVRKVLKVLGTWEVERSVEKTRRDCVSGDLGMLSDRLLVGEWPS